MQHHLLPEVRENLRLAFDLARRDLSSKYRRSIIGAFWLVLTPLCLLGIYSLVFGLIFHVEWYMTVQQGKSSIGFVLPFFVGLSVYLTVSDVVNSSSILFSSKRTYVVKCPFPLWVLWASNLMRASVHSAVIFSLVFVLALVQHRLTMIGLFWVLISLFVCILFVISLSLLLASIGPFIGDISEAMRLILRVLFYATPITYPLSKIPDPYHDWMWLNPLTCMVELMRAPIVFAQMPPLVILISFCVVSIILFVLSIWIFNRVKGVISDVI